MLFLMLIFGNISMVILVCVVVIELVIDRFMFL